MGRLRLLPPEFEARPRPLVVAHRGNSVAAPENTLAAFRRAIDDGADVLETDLHLTRDGVFVCIHDGTLDRTTGSAGAVADLTFEEVRARSAGHGRPGFGDERVPSLSELAALVPEDVGLLLELKTDRFLEPAVARQLAGELRKTGVFRRSAVLSFAAPRVAAVKREVPELPGGVVTLKSPFPPAGVELAGAFWPLLLVNPLYAVLAHARGMLVAPLDPEPDGRLWLYRLLGCDAVLTNDPASTLARLGRGRRAAAAQGPLSGGREPREAGRAPPGPRTPPP